MASDDSARISVSEDKLYRALGELELRIVKGITEALDKKAEQRQVDDLQARVEELERSRISRSHLEADMVAATGRVNALERESGDRKAVHRALRIAIGMGVVSMISIAADLAIVFGVFHH